MYTIWIEELVPEKKITKSDKVGPHYIVNWEQHVLIHVDRRNSIGYEF